MYNSSRLKYLQIAMATCCLALIAPAMACAAAPTPSSPHCSAEEYHQFDFWIGDWNVVESDAPDGPSVGHARIEPIAQGCAIRELYEQSDGLIGDSILSYDPVRKQWQQTWVTNRGSIMVLWGNSKDGVLVLEGDVHLGDGTSVMQRITWTVEDRGVRESALLSKDSGKSWAPAFDVMFVKKTEKRE